MKPKSENAITDFIGDHIDAIIVGVLVGVTAGVIVSAIQLAVRWISRYLGAAEQRKFIASTLKEFRTALSEANDLNVVDSDSGESLGPLSADSQRVAIYKSLIEHLGTVITKRMHNLSYEQQYELLTAYGQRRLIDWMFDHNQVPEGMEQYEKILFSAFRKIRWLEF